ncbi:hypothetical protein [Wolbachia endosymbiont (group A) of Volucella bombylans]|uniref:hypothetical protein n=1 Tax=unclassified Wolbachia TaxID=2640676 RepID=UPI0031334254
MLLFLSSKQPPMVSSQCLTLGSSISCNPIKNVVFYITLLCLPTQCPIKIPGSQCQALG